MGLKLLSRWLPWRARSGRKRTLASSLLRCECLEGRSLLAVIAAADSYRVNVNSVLDTTDLHELVPLAATWSYLAASADPSLVDPDFETTWYRKDMQPASYDGPQFQAGPGLFGFGGIGFQNPPGTELEAAHTAYFTRTFQFAGDPARVGGLVAEIVADDGAIIYVNGQTVGRLNMGPDDGVFNANAFRIGNEEGLTAVTMLNRLVAGTNYLAVSVHNRDFGDTDLGFDMRLGYRWRGDDSVLDNDASDAPPPTNVLRVVEVQSQAVGTSPVTIATAHGTLTMRPDGTFRYAPSAGYVGADSFTYKARDGVSVSTTITVAIQVESGSGPTCDEMDFNATGRIDRGDFAAVVAQYGRTGASRAAGDLNGDGRVGIGDFVFLRDALGQMCGGASQAIVAWAQSVDRVLSRSASHVLPTSVRRLAGRQAVFQPEERIGSSERSRIEASRFIRVPDGTVLGRGLRARRGALA